MITAAGNIIRIDVEGISQFGRNAQGVKLMTLNDDDKVVSLAAVQQAEDDVTEEVITDDSDAGAENIKANIHKFWFMKIPRGSTVYDDGVNVGIGIGIGRRHRGGIGIGW